MLKLIPIIIIKKRLAMQCWERAINILSVRTPQHHNTNAKNESRRSENSRRQKGSEQLCYASINSNVPISINNSRTMPIDIALIDVLMSLSHYKCLVNLCVSCQCTSCADNNVSSNLLYERLRG